VSEPRPERSPPPRPRRPVVDPGFRERLEHGGPFHRADGVREDEHEHGEHEHGDRDHRH
jgi:hypothetical protein